MPLPDESTITAWARLMRAQKIALRRAETALKSAGFPPLSSYDALFELRRSPKGLRANELESQLLLEQYNLSRLVDRLERQGYLTKEIDPNDGRGRILKITGEGRKLLKRMWPVYGEAIESAIGQALSERERIQLGLLLARVR